MDGNQQSGVVNGLVWVVIIIALIIGGIYVYNNYSAQAPIISGTNENGPTPPPMATSTLDLRSAAFQHGGTIPAQNTCDGANSSPPLMWSGAGAGTQSFALIMDDPDVPKQVKPDGMFDHWVLFNIPATTSEIAASSAAGVAGVNGAGKNAYTGPCPPSEYEPSEHRYFFRLYALDTMLDLTAGATKDEVQGAMRGHILQEAELMGRYRRQ